MPLKHWNIEHVPINFVSLGILNPRAYALCQVSKKEKQ